MKNPEYKEKLFFNSVTWTFRIALIRQFDW